MTSHKPRWHKRTGTDIGNPATHVSVISECNRAVASYQDSSNTVSHFPVGTDTGAKKDTCRSIHVFRSSSKLPWLSGSTRRHFPIRKATKNKQLGVGSHTYQSISITYTQYARYV